MDDQLGSTEYYASTDYNQRLEEKAELLFESKTDLSDKQIDKKTDTSLDIEDAIKSYNLNILNQLALKALNENDYMKLLETKDKDIYIRLARNTNITDAVAEKLIGTVYLAHKNLLENPSISENIKKKLIQKLTENPVIYRDLLH